MDFARSSCAWLLRDQESWGRFALDAVLTVGGGPVERCVLGAQVFAGNVYAGEGLFKDPPYRFSAAFTSTHFRIFRDLVRGAAGGGDSSGLHREMFREIRIDLRETPCRAVSPEAVIAGAGAGGATLSARIDLPAGPGRPQHTLEFPVRHINLDTAARRFQVETGPLLVLGDGNGGTFDRLRRAFVNFAADDVAEFLVDTPRDAAHGAGWSTTIRNRCDITLLEIAA